MSEQTAAAEPIVKVAPRQDQRTRRQPPYHVVLLDDDHHSYEYVIEMLQQLFGHEVEKAFLMAKEVDATGRVIVLMLEHGA